MTFLEILRLKHNLYKYSYIFILFNWQCLFFEWTFVNTDLSSSILCWSTLQFTDIADSWWIIKKLWCLVPKLAPLSLFQKKPSANLWFFLTKVNVKNGRLVKPGTLDHRSNRKMFHFKYFQYQGLEFLFCKMFKLKKKLVHCSYWAKGLAWIVTSLIWTSFKGRNVFSFTGSFSSSSRVSKPSIALQRNK